MKEIIDRANNVGPITGSALRDILNQRSVFRSGNLPSPEKFDIAARTLNGARRHLSSQPQNEAWLEAGRRRLRLVEELMADFEAGDWREQNPLFQALQSYIKANEAEEANEQFVSIRRVLEQFMASRPSPKAYRDGWRQIADGLSEIFTRLTVPTEWGISSDGPRARFVAAVIPLVTGETPTTESVAENLKEWREWKQKG